MTIYLITVRTRNDDRYVDSLWVSKDHADQRVESLKSEWKRSGFSVLIEAGRYWAWSTPVSLDDGQLSEPSNSLQAKLATAGSSKKDGGRAVLTEIEGKSNVKV